MNTAENHPKKQAAFHHDWVAQRQWLFVIGLGILSLVLGTLGFLHGNRPDGQPMGGLDAFYNSMRLFHMHFEYAAYPLPWELQIARFLAPIVLVVTLFKGFILVARSHGHALKHHFKHNHVVICGLGQKGLQLALQCQKKHEWVIVIEKNPTNELLSICDDKGIYCLIGDATEVTVLRRARVVQAKEIIIVTPEDETNLRIAMHIRDLELEKRSTRPKPKCFVHLENIHLRQRLQQIFDKEKGTNDCCDLNFFDVYDSEARRVLFGLPLDGTGIAKDDPRSVHVVIFGFGRMGRSLALRAAKMGHFANGKKLRVSVIDRAADRQREHFLFHHPILEKESICDLKFHQTDAQSLTTRKLVENWATEKNVLLHLFVCIDDNASAMEVGLRLQEILSNRPDCSLWARVKSSESLAKILQASPRSGPQIRAFGMLENACCDQAFRHEFNENIARSLHEAFVQNRLANSSRTPDSDPALRPWAALLDDFRESNRQQADHMGIKLRALGLEMTSASDTREAISTFSVGDIELLAELEHHRWNAERWLAGWRYGTPSDKSNRINENLVSWNELHDSIKQYDRETITDIPKRLAAAQMKVVRDNRKI